MLLTSSMVPPVLVHGSSISSTVPWFEIASSSTGSDRSSTSTESVILVLEAAVLLL
jgi:hypothetical protein